MNKIKKTQKNNKKKFKKFKNFFPFIFALGLFTSCNSQNNRNVFPQAFENIKKGDEVVYLAYSDGKKTFGKAKFVELKKKSAIFENPYYRYYRY